MKFVKLIKSIFNCDPRMLFTHSLPKNRGVPVKQSCCRKADGTGSLSEMVRQSREQPEGIWMNVDLCRFIYGIQVIAEPWFEEEVD